MQQINSVQRTTLLSPSLRKIAETQCECDASRESCSQQHKTLWSMGLALQQLETLWPSGLAVVATNYGHKASKRVGTFRAGMLQADAQLALNAAAC